MNASIHLEVEDHEVVGTVIDGDLVILSVRTSTPGLTTIVLPLSVVDRVNAERRERDEAVARRMLDMKP